MGSSERINMDGIVRTEHWDSEVPSNGCVQAFRNGIVEVIADDIVFNIPNHPAKTRFYRTHHENYLKKRLPEYLNAQKALGIPLPLWGFLTLAGMKGVRIKLVRDHTPKPPIDRDVLWLPEIQIADYAAQPLITLRPLFDMIWNAGGYPKCLDFDEQGEFVNVT